ncbi:MAG: diphthine--ammonia ligase [Bacteroidia bacterium]|nr:diphthine--ammonia ligase [Bacteroidia bacterium]
MLSKEKVIFCWSGGKDSALALYKILQDDAYEIIGLLTTINKKYKRVSMHGVREELIEQQAKSIDLPLIKMYVTDATYNEYEIEMEKILLNYQKQGVNKIIFGDIFLEDLRTYRESNLKKIGMKAEFPLWKKDTRELIKFFFELGFQTIVCCVNDANLSEDRVGVELDKKYINNLPENVDPCGENGEFHTYCYAGPIFKYPIKFIVGEKIYKPLADKLQNSNTKGFWYCDLL